LRASHCLDPPSRFLPSPFHIPSRVVGRAHIPQMRGGAPVVSWQPLICRIPWLQVHTETTLHTPLTSATSSIDFVRRCRSTRYRRSQRVGMGEKDGILVHEVSVFIAFFEIQFSSAVLFPSNRHRVLSPNSKLLLGSYWVILHVARPLDGGPRNMDVFFLYWLITSHRPSGSYVISSFLCSTFPNFFRFL